MLIDIRGNHGDFDRGYHCWVERHLRVAFNRVERRVQRVAIHLIDVDPARGHCDRRCVLRVTLEHGVETIVQERDTDTRALLERAIERCRRVLNLLGTRPWRASRPAERVRLALPLLP